MFKIIVVVALGLSSEPQSDLKKDHQVFKGIYQFELKRTEAD